METRTLIVTASLVATTLLTSMAGIGALDPATAASHGTEDLTLEDLETGRITYSTTAPDWSVVGLTLTPELWGTSDWNGPEWSADFELTIAIDPDPGAEPYLLFGMLARPGDPFPVLLPLALPADGPVVDELTIEIGCAQQCPETPPATELAFLLGDMAGTSTVHLAVPDPSLPEDPEGALATIEARDRLDVDPDATGTGGFAGTYTVVHDGDETVTIGPYGAISVNEFILPAGSGRTLEIRGGGTLGGPGVGSIIAVSAEDTSIKAWDWSARLGEQAVHRVAASASGPADTLPEPLPDDPVVGFPPAIFMQVRAGPGQGALDLEERIVPAENGPRTTLASWGWTSADLPEIYGWPFQDIVAASSPIDLAPADPATATRLCTGLLGPVACLEGLGS